MTIDEVLWLNEIIEINNYMDDHWERERKRVEDIKNRQPK